MPFLIASSVKFSEASMFKTFKSGLRDRKVLSKVPSLPPISKTKSLSVNCR